MARRLLALGGIETMTADLSIAGQQSVGQVPMKDYETDAKDSCDDAPHPHWLFRGRVANRMIRDDTNLDHAREENEP
jgi:hypothetical protein